MSKFLFTLFVIVGCIVAISEDVQTSSSSPPLGNTNAPGEQTCSRVGCHSGAGNPNNNSGNVLTFNFNNNNPTYTPGAGQYPVIISNTDNNGVEFGFEATALTTTNAAAGTFDTITSNTGKGISGARQYIFHRNSSATSTWAFYWTPPATNIGDVVFYVASNAANGNNFFTGDVIYVDTFIVRAPAIAVPTAGFTVNDASICQGESVIFTDASSSDVTAWSWNFGAGATPATANTKGPHTVTYSSSGSKSVSLTVTAPGGNDTETNASAVFVSSLPVANVGNNTTVCRGSSVGLTASGGISYSWSPTGSLSSSNIASPSAFPTVTTTYTVTVTDMNGCSATDQVTVTVPIVNADAGNSVAICPGASTQLNATGGTDYSWSPFDGLSATNVANPLASPTTTTVYSVIVTDANGCTASDNVTVTVGNTINASAGANDTICRGESAQLNASGGTTYQWSPSIGLSATNIANPVASPTVTTTYTVTVSANNCTVTDDVTLTVNQLPTVSFTVDDNAGCQPHTVNFANSTPNTVSCNWDFKDGGNSSSCTVGHTFTQPGNYMVSLFVTDINGCTAEQNASTSVFALPNASAGGDVTICTGGTVQLTASGGTSYLWSTGETTQSIIQVPVVDSTFVVTVTNANGCAATDDVRVSIGTSLALTVSNDTTVCEGTSVQLFAGGGNSFTWTPSFSLSNAGIPNPIAFPTDTTVYKVIIEDGVCIDSAFVTVNVTPNNIVATAVPDTLVCEGSSVQLLASGGNIYSWSPSVYLSNPNIANPVSTPFANMTYTVQVSDGICVSTDTVNVEITPTLQTSVTADTTIITSSTAIFLQLDASGGDNYQWQPATGLDDANSATPVLDIFALSLQGDTTITYTVTITKGACSVTESVNITVQLFIGVNDVFGNDEIKVFPNPASAELNFTIESRNDLKNIEIYNLTGMKVMEVKTENENQQSINISSLAEGNYLLRFLFADKAVHKMFQVK